MKYNEELETNCMFISNVPEKYFDTFALTVSKKYYHHKLKIMKKIILTGIILASIFIGLFAQGKKSALLLIDIQNFYFPGGKSELVEPEKAAANASLLLNHFRNKKLIIVHVCHNYEPGGEINEMVAPLPAEMIFRKNDVNCFKDTGLLSYLKKNGIDSLVICGMQTHMCVEAATRAASDLGFNCILVHDACATKDLKFGDKVIKSEDVHYATLSTLKSYATVISTEEFLKKK
jgi:nicotinamidase-related amidase